MNIHVAICEDEKTSRRALKQHIQRWSEEQRVLITFHEYESGEVFLFDWDQSQQYDIIFLDISMPGIDGMEVAGRIRATSQKVALVFVTNLTSYVFKGYSVNALQYLLKPVKYEDIALLLDRLKREHVQQAQQIFTVSTPHHVHRIAIGDILYLEADGHYIVLHRIADQIRFKQRMSVLEKEIGFPFFRCYRSILVNMNHIALLDNSSMKLELSNGQTLPVASTRMPELQKHFLRMYARL